MIQAIGHRLARSLGNHSSLVRKLRPAYEHMLNYLAFGGGIRWSLNGTPCRIDARFRAAMGKVYDPEVAALLRRSVNSGAVCFNVGAHMGVYVLQFAEWSKPDGRVVAFEPNPHTLEFLKRHIAMNGLNERVTVVGNAVSDFKADAEFYAAYHDGMSRLGAPNSAISHCVKPISVSVTTIDHYVEQSGLLPDILFIDVEGFEMKVLAGARRTLGHRPDIKLVVEMHPDLWTSAGTDRTMAESFLKELGLYAHPLTKQQNAFQEHGLVELRRAEP